MRQRFEREDADALVSDHDRNHHRGLQRDRPQILKNVGGQRRRRQVAGNPFEDERFGFELHVIPQRVDVSRRDLAIRSVCRWRVAVDAPLTVTDSAGEDRHRVGCGDVGHARHHALHERIDLLVILRAQFRRQVENESFGFATALVVVDKHRFHNGHHTYSP
jgi:hypothetical protein